MCTSYYIGGSAVFAEMIREIRASSLTAFVEERLGKRVCEDEDVYPGSAAPVIARNKNGERKAFAMQFGFVLNGAKKRNVVNARVETAAEKPLFAEAWRTRRCVIPATYYYEWEHPAGEKAIRYAIRPSTADLVYLCGLYRTSEGIPQFVVLTREAADDIAFIHDRMPVMIPASRIDDWLDPGVSPEAVLQDILTETEYWRPDE